MQQRGAAALLDGGERTLDPRVRVIWTIGAAVPVVVLAGGGAIASFAFDRGALALAVLALGAVLLAASAVGVRLAWARWRWRAHDDALDLRHGVVIVRESLVPFQRIQQIDIERGPLERWLGLSTLVLRTAAATTDATIPGIPQELGEELRHLLLARAGVDDAV